MLKILAATVVAVTGLVLFSPAAQTQEATRTASAAKTIPAVYIMFAQQP
ncbi:hypothetical protein [Kitasatospora sp. HPMI-4]